MPNRLINKLHWVAQARYGDVVLLGGLLIILFILHVGIPGTVPTGAAPGNWLALAREARGSEVMSAEVTHPPLFSALIAILLILGIPPIDGLLAAALLAKAALVVAVYLTSLTLNRVYATVTAALVAMAAAQMELYARGAYPQILGMAFGLLAVFLIVRYVDTREKRHLWIGLGLVAATLVTDLVIGALVPVVIAIAIVSRLLLVNDGRSMWEHRFRVVWGAVGLTALTAFVLVLRAGAGGESILDPHDSSRWESLSYVFRDAPWLWAVIFIGAVIVLPLRYWPTHIAATLAAAASWLLASGVLFLTTGAQSGLLISQMSVVVLAVIGMGTTHQHLVGPEPRRYSVENPRSVRDRLLIIVGLLALTFLMVVGLAIYGTTADRYRLVDHAELAALNSLSAESGPGDLVVAARGKGGMAVGWWVEGFAGVPTYTGHDPRLLAFHEAREQAKVANDIFNGALNDVETLAKLREIGADYLVVDRRGPDSAFLNSDLGHRMRVIDGSSNLVIIDARPDT